MNLKSDLVEQWKGMYEKLISSGLYNQTEALEYISRAYGGVTRSTLRYHLFPSDRAKQIKSPGHQYPYQRQKPRSRARYSYVRYHIDEILEEAFQKVEYRPQEIADLSLLVKDVSGILLRPSALLTLNRRYKEKTGQPLLYEVPGYDPPRYSQGF